MIDKSKVNCFPTNFYIKAKIEMLDKELDIKKMKEKDEEGNDIGNFSINTYLASKGDTVELFSTDGFFLKALDFDIEALDEIRTQLSKLGLKDKESFFILSWNEHLEELKKPEWGQL